LVRRGAGFVAQFAADQMAGKEYILFLKMILYILNGKVHQPSYMQKEERKKKSKVQFRIGKKRKLASLPLELFNQFFFPFPLPLREV